MSYVKIWIHLVFSTKNRIPLISKEISQDLYTHILWNCRQKDVMITEIGGYMEHIHVLMLLGKTQNISDTARYIKGESSFWINRKNVCPVRFEWQDDYYAVSVSNSHSERVANYIKKQEIHHAKNSFDSEIEIFIKKHGFQIYHN